MRANEVLASRIVFHAAIEGQEGGGRRGPADWHMPPSELFKPREANNRSDFVGCEQYMYGSTASSAALRFAHDCFGEVAIELIHSEVLIPIFATNHLPRHALTGVTTER